MASGERCMQGIGQPRTTTLTSTTQAILANMSIDDTEQSNKNTPVAAQLNMEILTQLRVDDTIQSPTQSTEEYSGQVDPITVNSMVQRATGYGLTSGFSDPVFGQTAIPIQHPSFASGRIAEFDSLASNAPSFGNLAQSGGTAFGNGPSFTILPFGTSNKSNRAFECEIRSDADQWNRSAKASNKAISSLLADDGNSQNLKQPLDEIHGQEISTTTSTITHGTSVFDSTFGAPSGFGRNVFGQTASSKKDSSAMFIVATTSTSATSSSSNAIPVFGQTSSLAKPELGDSSTIQSITATKTDSSFITGSGTAGPKTDCGGFGLFGQPRPIFADIKTPASNIPFGQFSKGGGTDVFLPASSVFLPAPSVFSPVTSSKLKHSTTGLLGHSSTSSSQCPESATSSSDSFFGQEGTSESIFGTTRSTTPSAGFGFGQHHAISSSGQFPFSFLSSSRPEGANTNHANENFRQNVLASQKFFSDATNHDNEFCSKSDGYYGQVDPKTNTTTTQGVNSFTYGFDQPKFGLAATPHQQASSYNNSKSESLVQASDLRTFGDVAQSSGSILGSGSTFATPALGTSGFENPSGSGGSTFGSGPSFTGYRS